MVPLKDKVLQTEEVVCVQKGTTLMMHKKANDNQVSVTEQFVYCRKMNYTKGLFKRKQKKEICSLLGKCICKYV